MHNLAPVQVCFEEALLRPILYALKIQTSVIYIQQYQCFKNIPEIPVTKVKGSSIFSPWCGGGKKQPPLESTISTKYLDGKMTQKNSHWRYKQYMQLL